MRDRPSGAELLALARGLLLDELMPLLPPERRFDALLVGGCLAIAEREANAASGPAAASETDLAMLYDDPSPSPERWRRFARDLRRGTFENSQPEDRQARRILWRLTLTRLRLANPKFLAANGLAEAAGGGG